MLLKTDPLIYFVKLYCFIFRVNLIFVLLFLKNSFGFSTTLYLVLLINF